MSTETIVFEQLHKAVQRVIPASIQVTTTEDIKHAGLQSDMSVLVALTGDAPSHIVFEASSNVFSQLSDRMFGMALEGDMLESFAGEAGNILAGTMATGIAQEGLSVNIGPPVVVVGHSKLTGFNDGISSEIQLEDIGTARISLIWR